MKKISCNDFQRIIKDPSAPTTRTAHQQKKMATGMPLQFPRTSLFSAHLVSFPRTRELPSTPAFIPSTPAFFSAHHHPFQRTSLFPAHRELCIFPSTPAFCQLHLSSFQRHQPNSPQFSATPGHFRASPRLPATSPHTSLAVAWECCGELRKGAVNDLVLRRTAANMSEKHM